MTPLPTLPACRWRGPEAAGRFACASPSVYSPRGVDAVACGSCGLADHEPHESKPRVKPRLPKGVPHCPECVEARKAIVPYETAARFDESNLGVGLPGRRFNPSILAALGRLGGYLLAYRDGWAGSEVWLTRLDAELKPAGGVWPLKLYHRREADYGREDPRLFLHQGCVHVAYTGVSSAGHTSVLFARLRPGARAVERRWYAHYPARNAWEKNWQPFSHGGALYAVYSVAPVHRVLRIDGDSASLAHETQARFPWPGGEVRGGAAPVRVGDEWWSFFHDRIDVPGRKTLYRAGLYTFSAEPPFVLRRFIPGPILSADPATNPDNYADVVWPGGAVRVGEDWLIACGIHDRRSEVYRIKHSELESRLTAC